MSTVVQTYNFINPIISTHSVTREQVTYDRLLVQFTGLHAIRALTGLSDMISYSIAQLGMETNKDSKRFDEEEIKPELTQKTLSKKELSDEQYNYFSGMKYRLFMLNKGRFSYEFSECLFEALSISSLLGPGRRKFTEDVQNLISEEDYSQLSKFVLDKFILKKAARSFSEALLDYEDEQNNKTSKIGNYNSQNKKKDSIKKPLEITRVTEKEEEATRF